MTVVAGAGLFLWSLGCFGSGMATGFYSLLSWRIVTGVGSAGIVTLAGPFIDDIAPVSAKTLWFGMLYLVSACTPSHSQMIKCKALIAGVPGFSQPSPPTPQVSSRIDLAIPLHPICPAGLATSQAFQEAVPQVFSSSDEVYCRVKSEVECTER